MFSGEMVFSLILMVLGLVWIINGITTGLWYDDAPAGGFMLLFIGIFMTLLSGLLVLDLIRKSSAKSDEDPEAVKRDRTTILIVLVSAVVVLVMMNFVLGTMITLTAFMVLWFKLYAKFKWTKTVIVTVCTMAIVYAIFILWLNVRFPTFLDLGII